MRLLLFWLFSLTLSFCASTDEKIKVQTSSLELSNQIASQLNKKLDDLAKDIKDGEASLKKTDTKMKELISQISELENNANSANAELKKLSDQNSELLQNQRFIEQNMISIISDHFAFDLIAPKDYEDSDESIIATEILANLSGVVKDEFKNLVKDYEKTSNLIKGQNDKIQKIESDLKDYRQKRAELASLQSEQSKTLANLKRDKTSYTKQLSMIQDQQKEIRKTLEELKIIARREVEEAKKLAEQKASEKTQKGAKTKDQKQAKGDGFVKQVGSSYQASLVKKYSGEKTIAPLDNFTVKQKFGNYIDPIYNIKIFNESVVLSSHTQDAKVKSVLSGKVIFAKDTAVLNKVVIIENANGIHTIYAHLSQIAPTIKVGTKVQKGYVIGRVAKDLTFEVTQKNYHIDPLEMISLK